ncbi:YceD family protein [Neisseriaceae bacterium TC5R-5]|nr:YceD family protein [Neisseriaceae bacterium TC5R-5]
MSNPILIDPLKFAREARQLSGKLLVSSLDGRVQADLASSGGELEYTLLGFRDELHRLSLRLTLSVALELRCQRCLETLSYPLRTDAVITLFTQQEKLEQACELDEDLDAILAEPELDVKALIEDEIIMGLPLAPKHDVCANEALALAKADKPNPFAVLAALKKSKTE